MKGKTRLKIKAFVDTLPFLRKPFRIAPPDHVGHSAWPDYLEREFNKPGLKVLEIGSRGDRGQSPQPIFKGGLCGL